MESQPFCQPSTRRWPSEAWCWRHGRYATAEDDGSSDRTAKVAELAGAEVIRHSQNTSNGAALNIGFEPR